MFDVVDTQVIHALQCSPRVTFRRVAELIGVSEQTVARRYQALRREGVLRVLGRTAPAAHRHDEWVARIRCRPDRVDAVADALVRRPDVSFAHITSGGAEVMCLLRAGAGGNDVLLQQLPRSVSVLGVRIDLLLHRFGPPGTSDWTGYEGRLTPGQERELRAELPPVAGPPIETTGEDAALLALLAQDGRAAHVRLARETGSTKARVARRLAALETSGALYYDVDLLPERLGYHSHATIWIRVAPRHLEEVGEELARHDEVAVTLAVGGPDNLMAVVICRDPEGLYRYLTTRIAKIRAIDGYEVSVRVRPLKQADSLIAGGRLLAGHGS
ncbi:AsnC family transcriptional regulator [Amycolatopsis sp., V23-08]|uniref:AsnC family transcriptional regulator n=1 Tax=Amycolatopsis heterodermiae TaxID=3110235 RepID=A0ABU5R8E7_9PSEU|nr:AsnC family transcriptional regulator [Amycolatopsis sp., V23-08]MEA5362503.1 AsnC family transcriptional regulator [Amycolatopsis sp., V23-08]